MMKNKKSVFAALGIITAISVISSIASAEINEKSFSAEYGIVTVSGLTDAKKQKVNYIVTNSDKSEFFGIGDVMSDENGSFEFSFGMEKSGDYIFMAKDYEGFVLEKSFQYMTKEDREIYLLEVINEGEKNEIKNALCEFGFTFDDKRIDDLDDENIEFIISGIDKKDDYENESDVKKHFEILNMLYKINTAKAVLVQEIIKEYADDLEIDDEDAVKTFLIKAKDAQKRALVKELSETKIYTCEELVLAIGRANEAKTTESGGSGGGGSSSSKGGAGSSGSATVIFPQVTEKEPGKEVVTEQVTYYDLSEALWAEDAVMNLSAKGVISGDGNGYFRPNDSVTREEFVKMVVVAFNIPYENATCDFLDVFENDWFYKYVGAANKAGVVKGISADFFGITKKITRQDAAVILARAADVQGQAVIKIRDTLDFNDGGFIAEYAIDSVNKLYEGGVIDGMPDGSFNPQDVCTRAAAAKMINKMI